MPEEIPIVKTTSYSFKGYFKVKDVFTFFNNTLKEMGYELKDDEFEESAKKGKEIKAKYVGEKPLNDYYLAKLKYKLEVSGEPVTVKDENGKEISTDEGSVELAIQGILEQDFMNKIEKTPMGKFLSQLYSKYIGPQETKEAEGVLKEDVKEVVGRLKQYINSSA